MSSVIRMLTRNWGLKLLSLALAIIIYYALKPDEKSTVVHYQLLEPSAAETSAHSLEVIAKPRR